ncbi:MAG: hypothetical protein VX385_05530, partial [Acidobacteriota bacterium]|nr:hypothetical protein [Acidobacteriota bacterium]
VPSPCESSITPASEEVAEACEKARRRAQQVPQRLAEVDMAETQLTELLEELKQSNHVLQ